MILIPWTRQRGHIQFQCMHAPVPAPTDQFQRRWLHCWLPERSRKGAQSSCRLSARFLDDYSLLREPFKYVTSRASERAGTVASRALVRPTCARPSADHMAVICCHQLRWSISASVAVALCCRLADSKQWSSWCDIRRFNRLFRPICAPLDKLQT